MRDDTRGSSFSSLVLSSLSLRRDLFALDKFPSEKTKGRTRRTDESRKRALVSFDERVSWFSTLDLENLLEIHFRPTVTVY